MEASICIDTGKTGFLWFCILLDETEKAVQFAIAEYSATGPPATRCGNLLGAAWIPKKALKKTSPEHYRGKLTDYRLLSWIRGKVNFQDKDSIQLAYGKELAELKNYKTL